MSDSREQLTPEDFDLVAKYDWRHSSVKLRELVAQERREAQIEVLKELRQVDFDVFDADETLDEKLAELEAAA